ncbi:MAG: pentapeptide repeat-containing protein [Sandaracinaceae bacterium]
MPELTTVQLAQSNPPLSPEALQAALAAHTEFLSSGGWGGTWETLDASGLIMGIYKKPPANPSGTQADFSRKNLSAVALDGLRLAFANLVAAYAPTRSARGVDLRYALATDGDWSGCDFSGADLTGCDFSRSVLRDCNFSGAFAGYVDFEGCDLRGASFEGAKVHGVGWSGAQLEGATGLTRAQ